MATKKGFKIQWGKELTLKELGIILVVMTLLAVAALLGIKYLKQGGSTKDVGVADNTSTTSSPGFCRENYTSAGKQYVTSCGYGTRGVGDSTCRPAYSLTGSQIRERCKYDRVIRSGCLPSNNSTSTYRCEFRRRSNIRCSGTAQECYQ